MNFSLNPVEFVEVDVEKEKAKAREELGQALGKRLYPASPEGLFLDSLLHMLLQTKALINDTGQMNLLAYARGEYLDHIGAMFDEVRLGASPATCRLVFTKNPVLSGEALLIPEGTRVKSKEGILFATSGALEISKDKTTGTIEAHALTPGEEGNGIVKGSITSLVDLVPYVAKVENETTTSGGRPRESDDHYRDRIHEAAEKFSTAGPDGSYRYWARTAHPGLGDVTVSSPNPGEVQIVALMEDGEFPNREILKAIEEKCNDRTIRPLTDRVSVKQPEAVDKRVTVKYWIGKNNEHFLPETKAAIMSALSEFVTWQTTRLGRDYNPDQLVTLLVDAGAKRVELEGDKAFAALKDTQVVRMNEAKALYQGMEEE